MPVRGPDVGALMAAPIPDAGNAPQGVFAPPMPAAAESIDPLSRPDPLPPGDPTTDPPDHVE